MRPLPTLLAAVLVAPLAACGADPGAIDVSVTGPDDVTLSAASRLTLSIYGYDTRIADQSATLIRTRVEPITALPVVVSVELPDDALARVDPTVGGDLAANVRFYLAGVLLNVLLNALLIPRWGALGAAWATFATQSGIFAAQLGLSVRHLALPVNPPLVVRILLFTALLAAAGYGWREWTGDWHWLVKFTGSVCTGGLLAFVFRLLDLKSWLQWLGKGG